MWTCAVLLTGVSRAQNFKYATIRWRQEAVVPPTVRFQLTTAWRRSAFSEARTGCQADCANVAGGLLCAKGCSGTSPSFCNSASRRWRPTLEPRRGLSAINAGSGGAPS